MNEEMKWNEWVPEDQELENLLRPGKLKNWQSHNPLASLKKQLAQSMVWAVVITVGYFFLFPFIKSHWVTAGILIMIIYNLFLLYISWRLYQRVNPTISPAANVLAELNRHYHDFQQWWKLQIRISLFVYPIAVSAGFLFGGMLSSGKSLEELMSKPFFGWSLLVSIIVLVPVSIWFAKWMFKRSFGKHLKALKQNMDELSRE